MYFLYFWGQPSSVPTSRIDLAGLAYWLGKDVVLQGPPLSLQGGWPLTKVYKRPWVDEMSVLYPDIFDIFQNLRTS